MKKHLALTLAASLLFPSAAAIQAAPKQAVVKSVAFNGMDAPKTIEEMSKAYSNATIDVKYSDGTTKSFPLRYEKLFKSIDTFGKNGKQIPAGTPIDANGNPIMDNSVPNDPVPFISDAPDSNSLLEPLNGASGKLHLVSHYEYQTVDHSGSSAYGRVPASMTLSTLQQDKKTGKLTVAGVEKIDFSGTNGLWIPCNGSLSPWNTHLGSEEYEPDARIFELEQGTDKDSTNVKSFANYYFGEEGAKMANPYWYGFVPEVIVHPNGKAKAVKHFSTGRFSKELMKMMPDSKTAYFGDDGSYTMMFMYIADKAEDLSSGTLYAAKFNQTGTENGGSGDLSWIKLGHATDKEIEKYIAGGITFSDIFETSTTPKAGFTAIKTYANKQNVEYLKVKPGMEKAAAFLETRRYAATLGATSEFNKMEGLALNTADKKAYMAISDQSKGMEVNPSDPQDDIRLPKIKSGVTYELDLQADQNDQSGNKINSTYVAASMKGIIVGEDMAKADEYGNTAHPEKVANPDNLSYSDAMQTLFIGEDSGMHTNNYVWAYDTKSKKLARILSVPAGAEATGLMAADDRNGFSYIMSNYQHPGDELEGKSITAVDKAKLIETIDKEIGVNKSGDVGYITGLPSFTNTTHPSKK
ncbi:DUF839 domain-containing protein [Bacillus sp. FJAT-29790]|uniref:PhoX family protein n=1 Tax=Bacillus sp. FJAT-29790 TaxID=1895002 RepID=UPI001C2398E5|nr:alkaline phosphatase PhoX [Bacillus sp. FJAT-29790]MBU8877504.1 DUF839 domain-containing protein [Bacillus sp. FJAT-29790]